MRYLVVGGLTENETVDEKECLMNSCKIIGRTLRELGHSLIICSPFEDSADYWVYKGFTQQTADDKSAIELYYVDMPTVNSEIEKLERSLQLNKLIKIPQPAPNNSHKKEAVRYAWLLCQLQALESCEVVIAIGGKLDGTANMLLLLAEAKRKSILPLSFMNGAANKAFQRNRYQLEDKLGRDYIVLQNKSEIENALKLYSEKHFPLHSGDISTIPPKFFISYPRVRPDEADYVETLLRRRNMQVYRDESAFGAGHAIPNEIKEAIFASNIFIAMWCAEYACSPWCFDEIELALDRCDSGKMEIWILCIDDTRIVPIRARNITNYPGRKREEVEGSILKLLAHTMKINQNTD